MTSFNANNTTPSAVSELVSSTKESNLQEPLVASIDSGPVQAYAKLEGDDFCYYIRTLQVSLGRKVTNPENVDIPLGNTKSVSRQHARLFYNFTMQRFELMVFGKNGAFVNEQFIERGVTVPLDNKTKIQIGEMAFIFLLPRADSTTSNTNNQSSPHHHDSNFGYISTPHQLEKNMTHVTPATQSLIEEDYELSDDDESGNDEPNRYNNKDVKPPYSYASLIAQAINSCRDKRMTLNGIYNHITTNYPYYQMTQNGWQNSIRHNLSLNKAFVKVARGETEPGKGAFWTIDVNAETQFTNGIYKRNKRTNNHIPLAGENAKKKARKEDTHKSNLPEEEDELNEEEEDENEEEIEEDDHIKLKKEHDIIKDESKETDTKSNVNKALVEAAVKSAVKLEQESINNESNTQEAQAQLQAQLQNTIRQHLLDPVHYPLPPSIAQLLPQAIAQLPPQLATQLSSTLQTVAKTNKNTIEDTDKSTTKVKEE